jgi:sphinganine-1-phosphate aldolase
LFATTQKFQKGVTDLGFKIVGKPIGTLFAYESATPDVNIYIIADLLEKKGWFVDRQMTPDSIHLTITPAHVQALDRYLGDLKEARDYAKAHPELGGEGMAAMYGMAAKIPDPTMVHQFLYGYMDSRYET